MASANTRVVLLGHSSTREHFTFGYGLARLRTFAALQGLPVEIEHLSRFHDDDEEEDFRLIVERRPEVVGLSAYMWNIDRLARLVARLREALPHTLLVMGGPSVLGYDDAAGAGAPKPDYLIVGEGELPFSRLLNAFHAGRLEAEEANVGGLVSLRGGVPHRYPDPPPYQDLDTLGSPYLQGFGDADSPVMYWETSRGCPFLCSFCVLSTKVNRMRYFSIDFLQQELAWAGEHGRFDINICDAALNYHTDRLDALTGMMSATDPGRKMVYTFALHSDYLNEAQIPMLGRINIKETTLGLNSINPATFKAVKRRIVPERFRRAVKMLNGLTRPTVTVVMGLPGDTVDGFKETLDFCATLDATIEIFELKVIPETTYYNKAGELGLVYDAGNRMNVVEGNTYTPEDLEEMRRLTVAFESAAGRWRNRHFLDDKMPMAGTVGRLRRALMDMGILRQPLSYTLGPWKLEAVDAQDHTSTLSLTFSNPNFPPVKLLLTKRTDQEKSFAHTAFFNLSHEGHGEVPRPVVDFMKAFHHELCLAEQQSFGDEEPASTG